MVETRSLPFEEEEILSGDPVRLNDYIRRLATALKRRLEAVPAKEADAIITGLWSVETPTADEHIATKKYVDDNITSNPVTASAVIDANAVVIGDDGARGVKKSTLLVSDNGEMSNPSQPSFCVEPSASLQNVTGDSTTYTFVFAAEIFDQNADWDGASTFTAPVDGKYHFSISLDLQGSSSHEQGVMRFVSSNKTYQTQIWAATALNQAQWMITRSLTIDMDASDTVTFTINIQGGAKSIDFATQSKLSGFLVC